MGGTHTLTKPAMGTLRVRVLSFYDFKEQIARKEVWEDEAGATSSRVSALASARRSGDDPTLILTDATDVRTSVACTCIVRGPLVIGCSRVIVTRSSKQVRSVHQQG